MATLLVLGIQWARNKAKAEVCTGIDVMIINSDSTSFVSREGVLEELKNKGINVVGKRMGDIDANYIEQQLKNSPYLENADCIKCQNGKVLVRVSQLVPVMRVFDGEVSYYVNRVGKRMDASMIYHCDVPVVQGHFSQSYQPTKLLPLINYVENDSLLSSLVTMYCVRDTNNIILVPSIGGHVINFGDVSGFENKFAKLKLFYQEVMPKRGWQTYDTISVKWDHQIVATRRVKTVKQDVQIEDLEDTEAPDEGTMSIESNPVEPKKPEDKKKADEKGDKKQN